MNNNLGYWPTRIAIVVAIVVLVWIVAGRNSGTHDLVSDTKSSVQELGHDAARDVKKMGRDAADAVKDAVD